MESIPTYLPPEPTWEFLTVFIAYLVFEDYEMDFEIHLENFCMNLLLFLDHMIILDYKVNSKLPESFIAKMRF